jgi:glycosyltransferase involved in cell wall biosynthesis
MLSFAIVVPNLNQSHFLPDALESLKCQASKFELAVMDGGSIDEFDRVVDEYSDIITHLHSAPDAGQAEAIRNGKDRIHGDIVAWLNADDYYFPHTLSKIAATFEENPLLDVIYGDAIHVTAQGFFLSYFPSIQDFNANDLTRNCFICQPACFVRRSAYERVGGIDPTLHYTMDWDLWCKLAESGARFQYLPEVLATVRYYPGTKTLSRNWKRYLEIWRIERTYGHRFFPRAWLGFYLFDLSFQNRKNSVEKNSFALLNYLRRLKKKLNNKNKLKKDLIKMNYGFHRWDQCAEGCCTIHIPWYSKRVWAHLRFKVLPESVNYRIIINGKNCEKVIFENGYISVELPKLDNPYRKISIECMDSRQWKLLDFRCDVR